MTKFLLGLAAGLCLLWAAIAAPNCPQEDSCAADYSHHHWTIREDQP